MKHAGNVGLQASIQSIGGDVFQGRPVLHASIVDQNVYCACCDRERIDSATHTSVVGYVESQFMHGGGTSGQMLGSLGEFSLVATIRHNLGASPERTDHRSLDFWSTSIQKLVDQ